MISINLMDKCKLSGLDIFNSFSYFIFRVWWLASTLISYSLSRVERKKQAARKLAVQKLVVRQAKKEVLRTKPQRLTFHG